MRNMPSPTIEDAIPSNHDQRQLQIRVYHPKASSQVCCAAVVAHPYAALGGSFDDAVVMLVVQALLERGIYVGTFNFRGGGRSSWTSRPEVADYETFLAFFQIYLGLVTGKPTVKLIVGGYSYGSMIASQINLDNIVAQPNLENKAKSLTQEVSRQGMQEVTQDFEYNFLLVSPLRPPVTWLLNPLGHLPFSSSAAAHQEQSNLTSYPTLAITGTRDDFTSIEKLRQWQTSMASVQNARFTFKEIPEASHFYREDGAGPLLARIIAEWVDVAVVQRSS